jgi:hypothetical protein
LFNPIISNYVDARYSILSYTPRIQQDDTTVDASIMIDDSMTFRDPDGTCMQIGDRIIRFVYPSAAVRVRESESVKTATIAPNTPQTEMDTADFIGGNGSYTHPKPPR